MLDLHTGEDPVEEVDFINPFKDENPSDITVSYKNDNIDEPHISIEPLKQPIAESVQESLTYESIAGMEKIRKIPQLFQMNQDQIRPSGEVNIENITLNIQPQESPELINTTQTKKKMCIIQ